MEWVAAQKVENVHLETVEETENAREKPDEVRHGRLESLSEREHTQGLPGCCRKRHPDTHTITNERLAQAGYFDIARKYKSLHFL